MAPQRVMMPETWDSAREMASDRATLAVASPGSGKEWAADPAPRVAPQSASVARQMTVQVEMRMAEAPRIASAR